MIDGLWEDIGTGTVRTSIIVLENTMQAHMQAVHEDNKAKRIPAEYKHMGHSIAT